MRVADDGFLVGVCGGEAVDLGLIDVVCCFDLLQPPRLRSGDVHALGCGGFPAPAHRIDDLGADHHHRSPVFDSATVRRKAAISTARSRAQARQRKFPVTATPW